MNTTISLLILAALAAAPQPERHPDAVEVYHCPFDLTGDVNFDRWPDGWQREKGPDFPHYLKIELRDEETAQGGQALRIEADGGAAAVYSPPIQVDNRFSYVLECRLRTGGLVFDNARVSITFYDAHRGVIEQFYSAEYQTQDDWTNIRIGPVNTSDESVEMAVIGLHLDPSDKQDLSGWVEFDDIWLPVCRAWCSRPTANSTSIRAQKM